MRIFLLITILFSISAQDLEFNDAEDCEVYYINNSELRNISYNKPIRDSMQIGFLHRSHLHQNEQIQIFIYLPGNTNRHLLIYIHSWRNISILNTKHDVIAAGKFASIDDHKESPFWNYIVIRMTVDDDENSLVSVLRPGDVTPIVSAIKNIGLKDHTRFRYTVVSNKPSYVAFNCLSKCPIMTEETSYHEISIPISSSFFIDVMAAGIQPNPTKTGVTPPVVVREFGYNVDFILENFSDEFFQRKHVTTSLKEFKWRCVIRKSANSTEVEIKWDEFIEYQQIFSDHLKYVIFTLRNNENNFWTFNCNPTHRPKCCKTTKHEGNSFGMGREDTFNKLVTGRAAKEGSGLGETVAWIIAIAAFLAVLVISVVLYSRFRSSQGEETISEARVIPQIKIDSGEDSSARNSFRKFKSSFRRKPPEECSEPGDSESDPNMLTTEDQFYPLQIITDDEQSEVDFGSLESRCSIKSDN